MARGKKMVSICYIFFSELYLNKWACVCVCCDGLDHANFTQSHIDHLDGLGCIYSMFYMNEWECSVYSKLADVVDGQLILFLSVSCVISLAASKVGDHNSVLFFFCFYIFLSLSSLLLLYIYSIRFTTLCTLWLWLSVCLWIRMICYICYFNAIPVAARPIRILFTYDISMFLHGNGGCLLLTVCCD